VADVLFGRAAPGGRLPVTLPRAVGQLPLYYNHKPSGARSQFWGDYADLPTTPLFPFGHGLSYTTFEYAKLELSARELAATDTLRISFDVSNTGDRAGEEVAQLYVCDRFASVTRPVKELKGFKRLSCEPGETRRVTFSLDLRQLAFYDRDMVSVVEPGEIAIWVGSSSEDLRLEGSVAVTGSRQRAAAAEAEPTGTAIR
jgi:beta-glucosidase